MTVLLYPKQFWHRTHIVAFLYLGRGAIKVAWDSITKRIKQPISYYLSLKLIFCSDSFHILPVIYLQSLRQRNATILHFIASWEEWAIYSLSCCKYIYLILFHHATGTVVSLRSCVSVSLPFYFVTLYQMPAAMPETDSVFSTIFLCIFLVQKCIYSHGSETKSVTFLMVFSGILQPFKITRESFRRWNCKQLYLESIQYSHIGKSVQNPLRL